MICTLVMDPLSTVNVNTDTSFVFMEEATRRGMRVWHTHPDDLRVEGGTLRARVREILPSRATVFEHVAWHDDVDLAESTLVLMRKDPPFNIDYIRTTYYLDALAGRTRVFSRPSGIRNVQEKLWLLRWPQLAPETVITRDLRRIKAFLADHGGRAVIKPWDGNGGRGIFVLEAGDRNLNSMLETATGEGRHDVVVQEYLPRIQEGDRRILLVDGVARAGFLRVPSPADHRGNMHVGATVAPHTLTPSDLAICEAIGPALKKEGHAFVGIDVIGDRLTEVNVTSPTGIQEANRLHGLSLETEVFDAMLASEVS